VIGAAVGEGDSVTRDIVDCVLRQQERGETLRGRLQSWIPDFVTYVVLTLAVLSIMASLGHDYQRAAQLILTAALLDAVDGALARRWGAASSFGAQLDSLVDLVAFGVAPAVLVVTWQFSGRPVTAAILGVAFVLAAAYRLARFNIEDKAVYFSGMSSTAAGALVACLVLLPLQPPRGWLVPIVAILALLMASRLPYYGGRSERGRLLVAVLPLAALVWALPAVVSTLAVVVLVGGLVLTAWAVARGMRPASLGQGLMDVLRLLPLPGLGAPGAAGLIGADPAPGAD
jgi:CDP-diacylglycerol---serine O-phosphatidyltransferase